MTETDNDSCCSPPSIDNLSDLLSIKIFISESKCTGCGLCEEVCPFGLPQPSENGKFEINDPKLCTECSACQRNCPTQAIVLQEVKGCGCLWNARAQAKNPSNACDCG